MTDSWGEKEIRNTHIKLDKLYFSLDPHCLPWQLDFLQYKIYAYNHLWQGAVPNPSLGWWPSLVLGFIFHNNTNTIKYAKTVFCFSGKKRIKGDHFLQQVIYMKSFSSKCSTHSNSPSLTESLCEMENQSPPAKCTGLWISARSGCILKLGP